MKLKLVKEDFGNNYDGDGTKEISDMFYSISNYFEDDWLKTDEDKGEFAYKCYSVTVKDGRTLLDNYTKYFYVEKNAREYYNDLIDEFNKEKDLYDRYYVSINSEYIILEQEELDYTYIENDEED